MHPGRTESVNVTNVRREIIPFALEHSKRKSVGQRFQFNVGDVKCACVCRRTKLPGSGRGVH